MKSPISPLPRAAALLVLLLSASSTALAQERVEVAQNYGEIETPRSTAVSGALHSTGSSTSALFTNPANLSLTQVYHVGAFVQLFPEANRQLFGAAIADSLLSSTGLAGGLSGAYSQEDPAGSARKWTDVRFALSLPIPEVLFVGVGGRYVILDQSGNGPLGPSYASGGLPGERMYETITLDAGVTLRPVPQLVISAVGHNLTSPDTNLLPLMGAASIGFLTSELSIGGDVVFEESVFSDLRVRAQGGAEYLVADRVPLRAGYRYDQGYDQHSISGGVGYVDPRFSIDLGFKRSLSGPEMTSVTFGFTVHLETLTMGKGGGID